MGTGSQRIEGLLTQWNAARGFGFITPVRGGRDVFVHVSELPRAAMRPRVGDALSFRVESAGSGKKRAIDVRTSAAQITPRPVKRMSGRRSPLPYLAVVAFACLLAVTALRGGLPLWAAVLYLVLSAVTAVVYALDKSAASGGRWRTAEATLFALGLVGGWPGAVLAQQLLRHKTRKTRFQRIFWSTVVINVGVFVALTWPRG